MSLELILLGLLLALSAFWSGSEAALIGLSKLRLRHLVAQGVKRARQVEQLTTHMDQLLSTILVGNNLTNTAISSLGTALCIVWVGPTWGVPVATVLITALLLLFSEITPKVFSIRHAEAVALQVATPMRWIIRLFSPLTALFTASSRLLLRLLGVELPARSPLITEEELRMMIELGKEEGVLGEHERKMLHRIFEFGDLKVKEVMVPREQMVMVPSGATHDDVLTLLTEEGHSRIPVYRDSQEQIVGILYAQELLHIWREGWLIVLQDLIHPPLEVPPGMRVTALLQEFQRRRLQIAIVVDDQRKALGMVTLEDLVEEIVGEIGESVPS